MQKQVFEKVLETAKKLKKPIIIHSRKAEQDALDILESSGYKKVIMHCFSGRKHLVKRAYDLGYYFSIPTSVVYIKHFQDIAVQTDIKQLFCETDAPYMSPFRGKRNEPSFVVEAYKKIAGIKQKSIKETADIIFGNYGEVFKC